MRKYTARRFGARWSEGAPDYVLDVFDAPKEGDRYTVMFRSFSSPEGAAPEFSNSYVPYLGMSGAPTHPQGVSMWGEMLAYEAAHYRYRAKHHRIRWLDLPEHIRKHVVARYED